MNRPLKFSLIQTPSFLSFSGNYISVPLMIEEVDIDDESETAPVILAGTDQLSTYGGGGSDSGSSATNNLLDVRTGRSRATQQSQFLTIQEAPQIKRQVGDWSRRLSSDSLGERRNRVWRQFNLD